MAELEAGWPFWPDSRRRPGNISVWKESLKLYDANLFLTESETLKGQLTEIEGREVVVTGDLETVRTESERLKTEYDELSQELEGLENLIQEERDAMSRAVLIEREPGGAD